MLDELPPQLPVLGLKMRYPWFLLLIIACVISQTRANLLQYVNEIPQCGVSSPSSSLLAVPTLGYV